MGNLHLVTGTKGEKHVTSADHASFHAAIFGKEQYVLNRGNKFAANIINNNQIEVLDGDILMQGRHIRLNEGKKVSLTIENGTQGMFRNDLIVVRYTMDNASKIEDCNLVVIKGTAAANNPVDPEYTNADIINDHVLLADMPLYRVPLDGINIQPLVPLFTEASLIADGSVGTNKLAKNSVTSEKIAKGAVSRSKLAADALYSPVITINSDRSIAASDLGATLLLNGSGTLTVTFDASSLSALPTGATIALCRWMSGDCVLRFSGNMVVVTDVDGFIKSASQSEVKLTVPIYNTFAVKKMTSSGILVTGNVEVVGA